MPQLSHGRLRRSSEKHHREMLRNNQPITLIITKDERFGVTTELLGCGLQITQLVCLS